MPWRETSPVQERIRFIRDCRSGLYEMTELCERYGISRKTGYKWLERFEQAGAAALEDRSRAPHSIPHRMSDGVRGALIAARLSHPTWGPRKLLAWLDARHPRSDWPSPSAVGDLLRREGLVQARGRSRARSPHPGYIPVQTRAPNELWTADFKGQFRVRDWEWCYPLTIVDRHSRYVLALQSLDGTDGYGVRPVFERVFREVGLPEALQTDNGPPFVVNRGLLGLTQLSVWWIRLGIRPLRIQPAHPEQNGAHERFHRTLKAETGKPMAANRGVQQRRFNRFLKIYNHERPHEALGQVPPSSIWQPSPRRFPERLPDPEYPSHFLKRGVSQSGCIGMHHRPIFISSALAGEWLGLEEVDDDVWCIYFYNTELGRYDRKHHRFTARSNGGNRGAAPPGPPV